ncbi:DUF4817 domain-containing protein [Trichonephila clavipes]|nr:DUF4817 domain-containing protein [Trichonephila clavipes]
MDLVILNHDQVTWAIPELAPPLLTSTPDQQDDVSAVDRFNVHRCPTRRVFSGTGLKHEKCNRNKREAARLYAIKFRSRRHPFYCTIDPAVQRLYKTGSCHRRLPLCRATPSSLRIPSEDVLGYAVAYPESSVRDISKACSYSKSTVWNILHTYGTYPYRSVLAQELMPGDQEPRFDFFQFRVKHNGRKSRFFLMKFFSRMNASSRGKALLIHRIRIIGPSKTHI